MTGKKDQLQGLRIASPCSAEWEGMRSDAPDRRFCQACSKHVHDFAQLTPREISGLLRASRGQLCARLTHDAAGRLVTLPPRALPPQPAPHRLPQLAAAAVLSLLGLGGAACADPVTALAAEAQEGTVILPGADRSADRPAPDRRTGGTRTTLAGTVTREASGEPLAEAEVKIVNLLDRQERTGRTAADGSFAFGSLKPGIYRLEASIRGWAAAQSPDVVVVPAGEESRVALTVSATVWDRLAADKPLFSTSGGVMMLMAEPLRRQHEDSSLVVTATAGRSVAVPGEHEWSNEVRTELVIDEVLKGRTGERVVQVVHVAEPGLQPGETVLAFLVPGDQRGRPSDGHRTAGYVPADYGFGLRQLSEAELPAYAERIQALSEITRDGVPHPEDLVDWLVATAERPETRGEAIIELSGLARNPKEGLAATRYTRDVRRALADFLAAGGTLTSDFDPAVLAAFLTEAQKDRLTHALLQTETLARPDLDLYNLVRPWSGREALAWLIERIETAEPQIWEARQAMRHIAQELEDESLASLVDNSTDAEVRAKFLEALAGRTVN
jgi:Carboxypeptidase regulatory-like domain